MRRALAVINLEDGLDLDLFDISTKHAQRLRRVFRNDGVEAFRDNRHNNQKVLLTKKERDAVSTMLRTSTPNDHGYSDSPFWSTRILAAVIELKYRVRFASKTSYYLLFREATFTFHLPGKKYEKADAAAVIIWKNEHNSRLKEAFADPYTVILCEDEMVLTQATTTQKVWIPQGTSPAIIETNRSRKNRSFYGFLNVKSGKEHAFVTERQTMYETAKILAKVRKCYPNKRILLIWDGAGWHRGSVAQAAVKKLHIDTIHFPPYSPELNPQEHVWKEGRSAVTHNRHIPNIEPVAREFADHLNSTIYHYSLLDFRSI